MRWISNKGVWRPGHGDQWNEAQLGRVAEVAEALYGSLVFQREEGESVIWMWTASGPQELIVAAENESLTLEGAGESQGDPVVFYQKHEDGGSPATTRSSLRIYNIATGEVREIMETGGWEAGTHFDHIYSLWLPTRGRKGRAQTPSSTWASHRSRSGVPPTRGA